MNELEYILKSLDELRTENREQHQYLTSAINSIDTRVQGNTTAVAVVKSKVAAIAAAAGLIASAVVSIAAAFIK